MAFVASYAPGAVNTGTLTASVTVAAGDVLVYAAWTGQGTAVPAAPTGGGLTFTQQVSGNSTNITGDAEAAIFTATSASSQTFTLTGTLTGTGAATNAWLFQVLRFSGVTVGSSFGTAASTTGTLGITTTNANAALALVVTDFNAVAPGTPTYSTATAGAFTSIYAAASGAAWTAYVGYHASDGTAGAKTIGVTAPTGQKSAIAAVELVPASSSFSGSLGLSGSGTLSFSGTPAISRTLALSGSGTLSFSGTPAIAGSLALSGSGALSLSGTASFAGNFSGTLALSGDGLLSFSGVATLPSLIFRGVQAQRRYVVIPPLTALLNYSKAVLRIQGQWVESEFPTEEQLALADLYFPGGYETPVDAATAALLTAAGYTVDAAAVVVAATPPPSNVAGSAVVGTATAA